MLRKHKVRINVTNGGEDRDRVLEGADLSLPARLLRFLFGDYTTVYLLKPGQNIESVEIHEVKQDAEGKG